MPSVFPTSLARTLDALDETLFRGTRIPRGDAALAGRWIAARQGLPGSYAGTFAPCAADRGGIRLFTGEPVVTKVGSAHVLGEDACRILRRLEVKNKAVALALARADENLKAKVHLHALPGSGEYCCGTCSIAMWRNLAAGGLDDQEARLADGVRRLLEHRRPDGSWRRYPFYYTLLALVEMDVALARPALEHAAPRCERLLRTKARRSVHATRRRVIVERVLAAV